MSSVLGATVATPPFGGICLSRLVSGAHLLRRWTKRSAGNTSAERTWVRKPGERMTGGKIPRTVGVLYVYIDASTFGLSTVHTRIIIAETVISFKLNCFNLTFKWRPIEVSCYSNCTFCSNCVYHLATARASLLGYINSWCPIIMSCRHSGHYDFSEEYS